LRRQFEKVKCRKLSSGEKKLFKKYAVEFFETRYGDGRNAESQSHADGKFFLYICVCVRERSCVCNILNCNRK